MTRSCSDVELQLSAFVDGALGAEDAAAIAAHLSDCAACRGLVQDLERLRTTARHLGPVTPPDRVWTALSARLPAPVSRQHTWPWLGLAAALVLAAAGTYAIAHKRPTGNVATTGVVEEMQMEQELTDAAAHYDTAIVQLEAIVKSDDTAIDPVTAALLRKNLPVMNQAIAESRAALVDSPGDQAAQASLFEALRQKVSVLQDAVELMSEMRRGNSDEAANVAAGMGKS